MWDSRSLQKDTAMDHELLGIAAALSDSFQKIDPELNVYEGLQCYSAGFEALLLIIIIIIMHYY